MQISRHWRMNAKRYRLEGVRDTSAILPHDASTLINDDAKAQPQPRDTRPTEVQAERVKLPIGA